MDAETHYLTIRENLKICHKLTAPARITTRAGWTTIKPSEFPATIYLRERNNWLGFYKTAGKREKLDVSEILTFKNYYRDKNDK